MTLSPEALTLTRLEKVALDNGFDRPRREPTLVAGTWLACASTRVPMTLWLGHVAGVYVAAVSQTQVARELEGEGTALLGPLPTGAVAARSVADVAALHHLARRAFQLARVLPHGLLDEFTARVRDLPRATEVERLTIQRVGQALFREGLIELWGGRCAVTGLAVIELLRASHIKPWAVCATDAERLDVFNGLLLAPQLDAAFDGGFITFDRDGRMQTVLEVSALTTLGLALLPQLRGLRPAHEPYLAWHREHVYRG